MIGFLFATGRFFKSLPAWYRIARQVPKLIKDYKDIGDELAAIRETLHDIRIAKPVGSKTGNYAVVVYTQGDKNRVKLFFFGNRNLGSIIDMMERFRRAGADVKDGGR